MTAPVLFRTTKSTLSPSDLSPPLQESNLEALP